MRIVAMILVLAAVSQAEKKSRLASGETEKLHKMISVQPGEWKWRGVRWESSLAAARERARKEKKQLWCFTAATGQPLGAL